MAYETKIANVVSSRKLNCGGSSSGDCGSDPECGCGKDKDGVDGVNVILNFDSNNLMSTERKNYSPMSYNPLSLQQTPPIITPVIQPNNIIGGGMVKTPTLPVGVPGAKPTSFIEKLLGKKQTVVNQAVAVAPITPRVCARKWYPAFL